MKRNFKNWFLEVLLAWTINRILNVFSCHSYWKFKIEIWKLKKNFKTWFLQVLLAWKISRILSVFSCHSYWKFKMEFWNLKKNFKTWFLQVLLAWKINRILSAFSCRRLKENKKYISRVDEIYSRNILQTNKYSLFLVSSKYWHDKI